MRREETVSFKRENGLIQQVLFTDRLSILDLYTNMVDGEILRIQTGEEFHRTPTREMKDFLIRNRLEVG